MGVEIKLSGKRSVSRRNPVPVASDAFLHTAILTLDTAAYAAGDTLADEVEIPLPAGWDGLAILHDIFVLDEDDQGIAFDCLFFDRRVTTSAKNAAWNTTDSLMRACLAIVRVSSSDYVDLGGNRVASLSNLARFLQAPSGSLFLYTVSQGAPTYSVNGLRIKLGFLR